MKPSITPGTTAPRIAILVLSPAGLALAHRLRATGSEAMAIFGPSCIVGACGGPLEGAESAACGDEPPPGAFATAEPGVYGFIGPIRKFLPALWSRFDAIVAVMAVANMVRLAGPLASDKRLDPAVIVVDGAGRFAVSLLCGQGYGAGADDLTYRVAAILGATPVVTNSAARSPGNVRRVGRR